jgi:hypothetical protein
MMSLWISIPSIGCPLTESLLLRVPTEREMAFAKVVLWSVAHNDAEYIVVQRFVGPPHVVGSQTSRHRFHTFFARWKQQARAISLQRLLPVSMPCEGRRDGP